MSRFWRGLAGLLPLVLLLACRDAGPTPPAPVTAAPTAVSATSTLAAPPTTPAPTPALSEPISPSPPPPEITAVPPATAVATPASLAMTVDQQNVTSEGGLWGVAELAPVGQSFVPAATSLDVVSLWVATGGPAPVTLQVVVYAGGLDGSVLGRSQPVDIPLDYADVVSFSFATAVSLQPGRPHALAVVRVSETGNGAVGWAQHANWNDPYPQGEAILQGQPLPQADLWFQLGRQE